MPKTIIIFLVIFVLAIFSALDLEIQSPYFGLISLLLIIIFVLGHKLYTERKSKNNEAIFKDKIRQTCECVWAHTLQFCNETNIPSTLASSIPIYTSFLWSISDIITKNEIAEQLQIQFINTTCHLFKIRYSDNSIIQQASQIYQDSIHIYSIAKINPRSLDGLNELFERALFNAYLNSSESHEEYEDSVFYPNIENHLAYISSVKEITTFVTNLFPNK